MQVVWWGICLGYSNELSIGVYMYLIVEGSELKILTQIRRWEEYQKEFL